MARSFNGSSHYLEYATALVADYPFTLACWFQTSSSTATQALLSVCDEDATSRAVLFAAGTVGGDPIRASVVNSSGTGGDADSVSGYTANTWHHAAGVYTSSADRAAFLDGGNKGTNTTSIALTGLSKTNVGTRWVSSSRGSYLSGRVAEAGIWSVALTDAEIASLGRGYTPDQVRPESLVAYWPLVGRYSTEIDVRGGLGLTVTGATASDHPRVFGRRKRSRVFVPAPAGGGGLSIPIAMYHYQHHLRA